MMKLENDWTNQSPLFLLKLNQVWILSVFHSQPDTIAEPIGFKFLLFYILTKLHFISVPYNYIVKLYS